mgnify:CR=1 FL=1
MNDFVEGAGQVTKTVHSVQNTIVTVIFSLILISGLITVGYCLFYSSTDDVKCGRVDPFLNPDETCEQLGKDNCGEKCYPYRKSPAIYMGIFFSVMALIIIIISNTMNHVVQQSSDKTAGVIGGVELVSSLINPPPPPP